MRPGSDLVFVGDVHLDRDDPDLRAFVASLRAIGATAGRIVLMGDLFNLWIGEPDLEQAHHHAVVATLRELRRSGTEIHYLEGNRDYRIGDGHRGSTFDAVSDRGLDESWGGLRIWAAHGDLVNRGDLQYRLWRRVSRSRVVLGLFGALPRGRRFRLAESVERRLRSTNQAMKRDLPEASIRAFAAPLVAQGRDAIVLGHFHHEIEIEIAVAPRARVFVLPLWKERRRHLRVTAAGEIRFEEA